MSKWIEQLKGWIDRLIPKLDVFGLEISDGLVRFYDLGKGGRPRHILLRLSPGAVVGGRVVNGDLLRSTLLELHKRIVPNPKKVISVVVTVPVNNIYIQPFNLPAIAKENLKESADLNMHMISPIDVSKAYYDWQEIGENATRDQLDMVGAFVAKDVADKFIEIIQEANFSVAAVEFSSLSLIRSAVKVGLVNPAMPSLVLQMDQGGLGFAISHMGSLYFHYFTEWDRYRDGGKNIDVNKFKEGVVDETRKLINFYLANFKTGEVKNMLIVAESFTDEVKGALQANFPGVQIQTANFNQANGAYGAALRGRITRSEDTAISLNNLSAVEVFRKSQIADFISLWRNFAFTTFGFLLFIFLGSALLLQNTSERVVGGDPFVYSSESSLELVKLEQQVQEFNSTVAMLEALVPKSGSIYQLVSRLTNIMSGTVTLRRMTITTSVGSITIGGSAGTEELARSFKDRLEADGSFENVDIPLQSFKPLIDGTFEFIVNMKLRETDSGENVS